MGANDADSPQGAANGVKDDSVAADHRRAFEALGAVALTGAITLPFTGLIGSLAIAVAAGLFQYYSSGDASHIKRGSWQPIAVPQIVRTLHPKLKGAIAAVFLLLLPLLLLQRYQIEVLTLGLLYATLAIGLNYIVGLCGLLVLGYIAFYAIGAYAYALLNLHFGIGLFAAWPLAMLAGALAGLLVGLPVMRLRGDYLAIVTLGFGEIVRIVLNNWDAVTAGPNGIMGIARPSLFGWKLTSPSAYYILALLLTCVAFYTQSRMIKSRIGRAWEAIREDELAAAHCGVPVVKMKLLAMAMGGLWAGAAGALFASRMTHVSPESFTFLESVLVLCMVVLGGMGNPIGVSVGAVSLIVLPELLRGAAGYRMLAFGLLLVLAMRYRREGFLPMRRLKLAGGN
ncbi:MAG: branched-chain amino acid ABC transporter permease [Calditrichaeota bacterium]|nr:branched-chain amino acid ABC transporter permease [Calditrichota bacterium]